MKSILPLKLISTGKALPARKVSSAELDAWLGKPAGYAEKISGVACRYLAGPHETQSELAAAALRDAMARSHVTPDSIDLVLSAAAIPEQALPCTGARLLEPAGLPSGTPAFDVNASCLSFLAALQIAASLLLAGSYQRIAIVASDLASRGVNWSHPESSLIFGDGAAAVIVEQGDGSSGIQAYRMETYPAGKSLCEIHAGGTRCTPRNGAQASDFLFHMEGSRLFRQTLLVIDDFIQALFRNQAPLSQIDVIVPHQASLQAMQHLSRHLGLAPGRIVDIYRLHGNQVAASLPTALHEAMQSGRLAVGSRALLLGTGAGLTLGGIVLQL